MVLVKDNIPGLHSMVAQLCVVELKCWLKRRGANQLGRKGNLVKWLAPGAVAIVLHVLYFFRNTYEIYKSMYLC